MAKRTGKPLSAMRWTGGKSAASTTGTGRWIAGLLPESELYIEPFSGMCGVLLQRAPSRQEIVNDLDGRVSNWWTVVRDRPDELARLIDLTVRDRRDFERACADTECDPVRRALDFTIVCMNALAGQINGKTAWEPVYHRVVPDWRRGLPDMIPRLSQRIRNVQIENKDAIVLLERVAKFDHAVLYVDPPYAGTYGYDGAYAHVDDRDALTQALLAQKGRVAVSGYDEEWDHLGWHRHEHATHTPIAVVAGKGRRTEVLWTSFEVAGEGRQAGLLEEEQES